MEKDLNSVKQKVKRTLTSGYCLEVDARESLLNAKTYRSLLRRLHRAIVQTKESNRKNWSLRWDDSAEAISYNNELIQKLERIQNSLLKSIGKKPKKLSDSTVPW